MVDQEGVVYMMGEAILDGDLDAASAVLDGEFIYCKEYQDIWNLANPKTLQLIADIRSIAMGAFAQGYLARMDELGEDEECGG